MKKIVAKIDFSLFCDRCICLSKSTWGEQPVEDILEFACICVCVCIYVCNCVMPPGQTKNDTDLKFGTHTPLDHILKQVFFSKKSPWRPLASKNRRVTWIFHISSRLPWLINIQIIFRFPVFLLYGICYELTVIYVNYIKRLYFFNKSRHCNKQSSFS